MTTLVSTRPGHPEILVRIQFTPDGWTGVMHAHLGRRFPLGTHYSTPIEAMRQLHIRCSHLDITEVDSRWLATLEARLAAILPDPVN